MDGSLIVLTSPAADREVQEAQLLEPLCPAEWGDINRP